MNKYEPNWTFSPGVYILEALIHTLANDLGYSPEEFVEFLNGTKPFTEKLARRLKATFGPSNEYWLNASARYQSEKAAGKEDHTTSQLLSLLGIEVNPDPRNTRRKGVE